MPKSRTELIEAFSEKEKYESSLSSLEELKTKKNVSEEQYNSSKDGYEKRITESKVKIEQLKKDLEIELAGKKTEEKTLEKQRGTLETRVKVGEIGYDEYQKEKRKLDGQIERVENEIGNLEMLVSAEKVSDMREGIEKITIAKSVEDLDPSQMDLSDVIVSPFRLLREHHQLFVPLGAIAAVEIIYMIMGLCVAMTTDPSQSNVLGIATLIAPVAIVVMGGWVIAMMREIKESKETAIKSSFSILMENIISIILGALLAGLIVMVGVICLVIPGIILAVALCCTVPAIVMHGFNAIEGLKASWKFCWQGRNFWLLLALLIPMLLLSILPVIGLAIGAFIFSLWIPYAYMEYVGSKGIGVSGIFLLQNKIGKKNEEKN